MDERELVLTSLIYPLIFREAAQIGIATPIAAHIRELLKIQTLEPEVTKIGLPEPVTASVRNLYQKYDHPLQDFAQIGVAKPVGAYFKNLFNEYIHPHSDFAQIGNAIPVSMYSKNMLQNLQTFKTDHVVQVSNAIPEAVYSTCKPVVFAPTNLRGQYNGESIQLFWSNSSITHTHQNLYRATEPFTEDNLPPVYQYIFRGINSYIDEDIVEGVTYYYAVSTEAGLVQLVSDITEVTAVVSSNCDPHWDKVVSLLHFDGSLVDETGASWSTNGQQAVILNSSAKFGDAGLRVDGLDSGIQRAYFLDNSAQPFTIELWMRIQSYQGPKMPAVNLYYQAILGQSGSAGTQDQGLFIDNGYVVLLRDSFSTGGSGVVNAIGSDQVPLNEFFHIALTYDGQYQYVFLNGVQQIKKAVNTGWYNGASGFRFGRVYHTNYSQYRSGSNADFDELRITKGVARYTEDFTPPTEPFPNFGCAAPQLPEVIGEEFGGGFYIGDITIPDGPDVGTYAIIMAGMVGQGHARWKTSNTTTVGTSSTTDGMANTLAMEVADLAVHPAAEYCLEYAGDGHNDWYLPAKDELNLAWTNHADLVGLAMEVQVYMSSTEYQSGTYWVQNFSHGGQGANAKLNSHRIRPVRRIRKA